MSSLPNRACSLCLLIACALIGCASQAQPIAAGPRASAAYDVRARSLSALQRDLQDGRVTSAQLVAQYRQRIQAIDVNGPSLHSVLSLNPNALHEAAERDAERAQGKLRGPLHGIPLLIKDNIETADPLPTTAGSLALAQNITGRDAPAVAKLRAQGAIVLGKANLSEWANIRSANATSGWSALGGLTKNPYALDRNACGSSSGSAVAVAAGLAPAALGTETDGSITCPASIVGLVGLKPTLGLISTAHVIPITAAQDTVGPITLTVSDLALLLDLLVEQTPRAAQLSPSALQGKRLGIMKFHTGFLPSVDAVFDAAVQDLQALGANIVSIEACPELKALGEHELPLMLSDFRREIDVYLKTVAPAVSVRSLADVIAFNQQHASAELQYFDQALFVRARATQDQDPALLGRQRAEIQAAARNALDRMLREQQLDALIAPTMGPAWTNDLVNGDHALGGAMQLPAVAGYPHLTVPMGQVSGLPVGLSFVGAAHSEPQLLGYGYAYEQRTHHQRAPTLAASTP